MDGFDFWRNCTWVCWDSVGDDDGCVADIRSVSLDVEEGSQQAKTTCCVRRSSGIRETEDGLLQRLLVRVPKEVKQLVVLTLRRYHVVKVTRLLQLFAMVKLITIVYINAFKCSILIARTLKVAD